MKRDCMFQYATNRDIIENTNLITLEEAKAMFEKCRGSFIKHLELDHKPEMCIWINCENSASYGETLFHWRADCFKLIDGELYQRV